MALAVNDVVSVKTVITLNKGVCLNLCPLEKMTQLWALVFLVTAKTLKIEHHQMVLWSWSRCTQAGDTVLIHGIVPFIIPFMYCHIYFTYL